MSDDHESCCPSLSFYPGMCRFHGSAVGIGTLFDSARQGAQPHPYAVPAGAPVVPMPLEFLVWMLQLEMRFKMLKVLTCSTCMYLYHGVCSIY